MKREYPIEKIVSHDGKIELRYFQLIKIYEALKIERFPDGNLHEKNWHPMMAQFTPQVQDPIISFSSKSLVLALNNKQVCKIRLDGKAEIEIKNIESINCKSVLFPEVYFIVDLPFGLKGIVMERIPILDKYNFTSGELNRLYHNFKDDIYNLHNLGIIHNDLGRGTGSHIRPNIVISNNRIRLLDFENIMLKVQTLEWSQLLEKEQEEITNYFFELIDFAFHTLT